MRFKELGGGFFLVFGCGAAWGGVFVRVRLAAAAPDLRPWKQYRPEDVGGEGSGFFGGAG